MYASLCHLRCTFLLVGLAAWWHRCEKWSAESICFKSNSDLFQTSGNPRYSAWDFKCVSQRNVVNFKFSSNFKMCCQREMITWKSGLLISISHITLVIFMKSIYLSKIYFGIFFTKICLSFCQSETSDLLFL